MTNSIRTPKQGVSETSRRIARAVDNEEWQKFRVSLKGTRTADKLDSLEAYWKYTEHDKVDHGTMNVSNDCDVCIRVDNYLKALIRGGQIESCLTVGYFVHCSGGAWSKTMTSTVLEGLRRTVSVIRKG